MSRHGNFGGFLLLTLLLSIRNCASCKGMTGYEVHAEEIVLR